MPTPLMSVMLAGGLFAWQFAPVEGTDLAVEIVVRGEAIGTLRVAEGAISAFNGVVYVQVDDRTPLPSGVPAAR